MNSIHHTNYRDTIAQSNNADCKNAVAASFNHCRDALRPGRPIAKSSLIPVMLLVLLLFSTHIVTISQPAPAPTLVPPTLVPFPNSGESEAVISESGIARIISTGRVRVGILYNEPPFGEFNVRGDWVGFDADLARAIAETWGVELRFRQVTRQTAFTMLDNREVDMLIAAQVHRRDLDAQFEFSQTYFMGSQSMMVRTGDSSPKTLPELANRRIGVTLGAESEAALANWSQRSGIPVTVQTFPLLDRAYGALMAGEIDGLVGSRHDLIRVATRPEAILIIDEALELEPYAIAMPRQDVSLRNLVNKTLQYLRQQGRIAEIRQTHFPESSYLPAVWGGLGEDAPKPDQFTTEVGLPSQFVLPRLQTERVLPVAIPRLPTGDIPESHRRLDIFYRSLVDEMARRWGVQVMYIEVETPQSGLEAVANGQADLAVGVQASWDWDERVDFTNPYLLRGLRLMVRQNSNIFSFEELRGAKYVAYPLENPSLEAVAIAEGRKVNAIIRTFGTRERDFAITILQDNNADVAFADSIALLPFIEQYPNDFQLTKRWYSEEYMVMATPRNDIDFRLLTEYTLQEFVRDGTLKRLITPVMLPDEIPAFDIWQGVGNTFGFNIGG